MWGRLAGIGSCLRKRQGPHLSPGSCKDRLWGSWEDRLRGRSTVEAGPAGTALWNGMIWLELLGMRRRSMVRLCSLTGRVPAPLWACKKLQSLLFTNCRFSQDILFLPDKNTEEFIEYKFNLWYNDFWKMVFEKKVINYLWYWWDGKGTILCTSYRHHLKKCLYFLILLTSGQEQLNHSIPAFIITCKPF